MCRVSRIIIFLSFAFTLLISKNSYSQDLAPLKTLHFPNNNFTLPSHLGKDTNYIIDKPYIFDRNIEIDGGILIINAPFRVKNLNFNYGKVKVEDLFVAKNIITKDSGFVNWSKIYADSIFLQGKGNLFQNSGRIIIKALSISNGSKFLNYNYISSSQLNIDDGGIFFNRWRAMLHTSSLEKSNYNKVVGCYECHYTLKLSDYIVLKDWLLLAVYLLVIVAISYFIKKKIQVQISNYFIPGLLAKIIFGILGILIYAFYYGDGDNFGYYNCIVTLNKLLLSHPYKALQIFFGNNSIDNLILLDKTSHFTIFSLYFRPLNSYTALRLMAPAFMLGLNSLLAGLVVINVISYIGIWKLFSILAKMYPNSKKAFAVGFLFAPSVLFWSSSILKDTIVFSALCWFVYNLIKLFIFKEKPWINWLMLLTNLIIISCIKPYVLLALFPFIPIFFIYENYKNTVNSMSKIKLIVVCLIIGSIINYGYMVSTKYIADSQYGSVGEVVTKARITQEDHLRAEQYGENSYNIGKIGNSFWNNPIVKAPMAVIAGLFYPFPSQITNTMMIVPAMESLILLVLSIFIIFKTRKCQIFNDPIMLVIFGFIILYSYGIGLSSANLGALSRFKIMIMPFIISFLGIQFYKNRKN